MLFSEHLYCEEALGEGELGCYAMLCRVISKCYRSRCLFHLARSRGNHGAASERHQRVIACRIYDDHGAVVLLNEYLQSASGWRA